VANLPPEFSDDRLAEAFDSFGMVLSASIARDPATGKRLRYGFVDIATERAAKLAVEKMNGTAVDGYNLDVRISERPTGPKKPPRAAESSAQAKPHRVPAPDYAAIAGGDDHAIGSRPRPQPRKQPTFEVERRSLPRVPVKRPS
jgi:RNA recognition motif-containing protein